MSDCQASEFQVEEFIKGYEMCALWSSTDDNGDPLDQFEGEVAEKTKALFKRDCDDFIAENIKDLMDVTERSGYDWSRAGHDFWLTRCGHGAGYWDRGLGEVGDRLTAAAEKYGNIDLYIGDDNEIHAHNEYEIDEDSAFKM
jgi:hypothetical protein